MNASYVKTKTCEQKTMSYEPTKQTQSKPIYGEPACPEFIEWVEPTKPNDRQGDPSSPKGFAAASRANR